MGFGSSFLSFLSNPLYVFGVLISLRVAYYIIRVFKVNGTPCRSTARLDGKNVIITGGNTGIGKETALNLARRGAKIYIACRDMKKAQLALEEIRERTGSRDVYVMKLDLASCKSIREFVTEYRKKEDKLHVLLLNAGVMMTPHKLTAEGFEYQFGINHLGHFLLTHLCLDMLEECAPSRVVVVSSLAHIPGSLDFDDMQWSKRYNPYLSYCRSKLANVMFARELAKRVGERGVTVVSLHPGTVYTEITRDLFTGWFSFLTPLAHVAMFLFTKTPEQGAQTSIHCAVAPEVEGQHGTYWDSCTLTKPAKKALDEEACKKLWDYSVEQLGL